MSTFSMSGDGKWRKQQENFWDGMLGEGATRPAKLKGFWADARKAIESTAKELGPLHSPEAKQYVRAARMIALWLKACHFARAAVGTNAFSHRSKRAHNIYTAMPVEAKMAIRSADLDDNDSAYVTVNVSKDGKISYSRTPGVIIVVRREGEDGEWIG